MATAILISAALMIWLADRVAEFYRKTESNVLGLFVLFIVGIMLITEGGHLAHLKFFNQAIVPMSKTTFYFVLGILVIVWKLSKVVMPENYQIENSGKQD